MYETNFIPLTVASIQTTCKSSLLISLAGIHFVTDQKYTSRASVQAHTTLIFVRNYSQYQNNLSTEKIYQAKEIISLIIGREMV